jgi:hypothetical protein
MASGLYGSVLESQASRVSHDLLDQIPGVPAMVRDGFDLPAQHVCRGIEACRVARTAALQETLLCANHRPQLRLKVCAQID